MLVKEFLPIDAAKVENCEKAILEAVGGCVHEGMEVDSDEGWQESRAPATNRKTTAIESELRERFSQDFL